MTVIEVLMEALRAYNNIKSALGFKINDEMFEAEYKYVHQLPTHQLPNVDVFTLWFTKFPTPLYRALDVYIGAGELKGDRINKLRRSVEWFKSMADGMYKQFGNKCSDIYVLVNVMGGSAIEFKFRIRLYSHKQDVNKDVVLDYKVFIELQNSFPFVGIGGDVTYYINGKLDGHTFLKTVGDECRTDDRYYSIFKWFLDVLGIRYIDDRDIADLSVSATEKIMDYLKRGIPKICEDLIDIANHLWKYIGIAVLYP